MSDKLRRIHSRHHRDVLWTTGTVQIFSQKRIAERRPAPRAPDESLRAQTGTVIDLLRRLAENTQIAIDARPVFTNAWTDTTPRLIIASSEKSTGRGKISLINGT